MAIKKKPNSSKTSINEMTNSIETILQKLLIKEEELITESESIRRIIEHLEDAKDSFSDLNFK